MIFSFNTDVDECSVDLPEELEEGDLEGPCDPNAYCSNTHGSFECFCEEGFAGNGFSCVGR